MLNPYLKSFASTEHHRKVKLLRLRMKWSQNEAIGFVHRFWWMVLTQAPSGVVSELLPEVMIDTLDMQPKVLDRALDEMKKPEIRLLDVRDDGVVLVHDWLDYAGAYLRDSLWKNHKEKWEQAQQMHGRGPSADGQPTVVEPSALEREEKEIKKPPNPRQRGGRGGGVSVSVDEVRALMAGPRTE